MSDLLYACIQLVHNLGAAAAVGSPAAAWWLVLTGQEFAEFPGCREATGTTQRRLAWFALLAWSTQIASGAAFGATTYYLKHQLPELTGVALAALGVKAACAVSSLALALLYLRAAPRWSAPVQLRVWQTLFALGLTALMSAAFLRWYA